MPQKSKPVLGVLGYSPYGNGEDIAPFDEVFDGSINIQKGMIGVDAVIFWGGTDISPSLYKSPVGKFTQSVEPSPRDKFEWKALLYCKAHNIPVIGVCRGAQLLCAFAGGSLVQHVNGHSSGPHTIVDKDGLTQRASSDHHQMMYPFDVPHEMIAWSLAKRSETYLNGANYEIAKMKLASTVEPEIVYFPGINGLAIQGHPEWMLGSDYADYCNKLVVEYLFKETVE